MHLYRRINEMVLMEITAQTGIPLIEPEYDINKSRGLTSLCTVEYKTIHKIKVVCFNK